MKSGTSKQAAGQKAALAAAFSAMLLSGCAWFEPLFEPVPPPKPPPAPIVSKDGLAPITDEQVERIREALGGKAPTTAVANVVRSASPTIESFVRTEGCITARNGAVLNPFAASARIFDAQGFQGGPMSQMQYHDRTACVTVQRMQNWKMVSPKLLRFEVVYVGDDGEESAVTRHEITRQPKGGWLFTR